MTADKRKLYLFSCVILAILLIALLAPAGSGRMIAAILLLPGAALTWFFVKKREILSIHTKSVIMLIGVIGLLYLMFYYVSALFFGFTRTGYGLKPSILFRLTLPIGGIIVGSELIRHILCVQKDKLAVAAAYLLCLFGDILICENLAGITTFSAFMDVVGLTLFPGIFYNLLYNYLTVRYGFWPNIIYRALTVWVFYLIPYGSAISDGIVALMNMFIPIAVYFFIDSLYEKKKRYALGRNSKFIRIASKALTVAAVVIMIGTVMLISNQFYYGALVIATDSMTGELNKGDVAIFESYENQSLKEGQVIVFEQNGSMVVHRIADIKIINEQTRYYTKGDANEDTDTGFRTDSDIVGLVNYKVPAIGYPTLWLRSLFKR